MRVAFVDLLFSWPPHGGADVDLYHVMAGLRSEGIEAQLFFAHQTASDEAGIADPESLPFPATRIDFSPHSFAPDSVTERFREALDAWRPDMVWVMHAFGMKPWLLDGLADFTVVSRYYAHELMCARDPRRFKHGAPCPNDYLRTPDVCRDCALESQRDAIRQGTYKTWTEEYIAARAYAPEYHALSLGALRKTRALVVSNTQLAAELAPLHDDIRVLPGGVDTGAFPHAAHEANPGRARILMSGRVDDPLKGLGTLLEAGAALWQQRQDFEIVLTHHDHDLENDWVRCTGWLTHEEALAEYAKADVCVVPSVWHEPFGLVAVEAMAAGRAVVASRTGGLADIVLDGKTGLLVTPGDAAALAGALSRLLDDPGERARMGKAGRARAESDYDWRQVVRKRYLPLLEELGG